MTDTNDDYEDDPAHESELLHQDDTTHPKDEEDEERDSVGGAAPSDDNAGTDHDASDRPADDDGDSD
ncbi:hypothetical protein ACFQE1_21725, partial [Halobium palmae]